MNEKSQLTKYFLSQRPQKMKPKQKCLGFDSSVKLFGCFKRLSNHSMIKSALAYLGYPRAR
jgi:hypothetical protein